MQASGNLTVQTPQHLQPILAAGKLAKMKRLLRGNGKNSRHQYQKLEQPLAPFSSLPSKNYKRKLKLSGKKKRKPYYKTSSDSSTETSDYTTVTDESSTSDIEPDYNWSPDPKLTPSQELTWTQFINKLCTGPIVTPEKAGTAPQN